MAIKAISKFTKTNSDTALYTNGEVFKLIETYFAAGKILQKPIQEIDGMSEIYITVFDSQESVDEFLKDPISVNNIALRDKWCSDNNVKFEMSFVEE